MAIVERERLIQNTCRSGRAWLPLGSERRYQQSSASYHPESQSFRMAVGVTGDVTVGRSFSHRANTSGADRLDRFSARHNARR